MVCTLSISEKEKHAMRGPHTDRDIRRVRGTNIVRQTNTHKQRETPTEIDIHSERETETL